MSGVGRTRYALHMLVGVPLTILYFSGGLFAAAWLFRQGAAMPATASVLVQLGAYAIYAVGGRW